MPDQTTSPDQELEKILGRPLAQKSAQPKEEKQQVAKPQIGPQQTPEDDLDKVLGRKVTPVPKKKSMLLSPEERTGSKMTAMPGTGGASYVGDEGIGKVIGAASKIDKPIEEKIHKVEEFTGNKIDQAADFMLKPQRENRDWLAANGYPTLAKLSAYSEAVNPVNIDREAFKTAAGMVTDPKNWPFILEGGGAVRPVIKTSGTALFTIMQQYGAIDALKNHDYASAAMQEAFALLGMKDLPAGIKETIGKEAGHQASGKSDTAKPEMTPPPEVKKAEGMTAPPEKPKFKNGSTQADIPEHSEAHTALETARGAIADTDLAGKGKDIGGNHVTVRYGIKSDDIDGVRNFLKKQAPFEATLGKTEKFEPTEQSEGAAVINAPIDSPEMHRINGELEKHGDFIDPTFDYKPHATVAYVKPEAVDKYVGMDTTHGKKFMVDSVTISGRDGKQEVVKLEGKPKGVEKATLTDESGVHEGEILPAGAHWMAPRTIEADPRRFQFRTEMSESGLSEVKNYNEDLGGIISVWKDPEDGKTYVVNGHHRLDLAMRADAPRVLTRYLDAPTAKEARAIGALQNIAEDKASGIDAAKFMRDSGKTPEDLEKMGFPLTGKAAKEGLALSKLSDPIFERVTMGEIPTGRAAVIGEELPDYADQTAVLQMIDSQGKKGVRLTDAEIREMARDAKADQKISETTMDLFGESTIEKSSSVEKAKLSVWLQKQLSRDKKLFGYVAKTERARELAKAGNIIDVDQSKAVAESSKITEEVYQRLVRAKGPIADALRDGAGRWARGEDEKAVKSETYQKVQAAVEQELKGGTYTPSPTDPIPGMGESRLREVLRSHPGMAGLADDLVDQAAILSQNAIGMPLDEFLRKNWSDVKVEGTPGKGALRQDESLWAWVKQSGSNLSIEPYGEQLSMFGEPEKTFMLRNKKGQEAMVLESQLNRLAEDFPALGKKIGFMRQTGKAVEFAPKGDAPAELPMEQGGLFGDIRRGVEDQEGSLFGPMEDEDPKLLFQDDNPVWYAKSQHILDDPKMPGSQTGHQWLSMLENKGVKADELKWMGIDDFLRDKKKVTKQELQDYMRENQVEVKEVVKTREDEPRLEWEQYGGTWVAALKEGRSFKIEEIPTNGKYRLTNPGGTVQVFDSFEAAHAEAAQVAKVAHYVRDNSKYASYVLGGDKKNYSELLLTLPWKRDGRLESDPFTTNHFEEKNILAHVRFDERTDADGNRVLFLEEVQSDWHQKGKKVGYRKPPETFEEWRKRVSDQAGLEVLDTPEERRLWASEVEYHGLRNRGVPDAPFKTDWHELVSKRMLRWSVEHGYDKLAWVTGEQTADRYDLSKQIDGLVWHEDTGELFAKKKGEGDYDRRPIATGVTADKLADHVGKEAAQKLADDGSRLTESYSDKVHEVAGIDLKVGGEWAKNLYDRAIPNFMSKYGKKWGAKVGHMRLEGLPETDKYTAVVPASDEGPRRSFNNRSEAQEWVDRHNRENPTDWLEVSHPTTEKVHDTVHTMDITESMRKSVMEGQPLFQGKKGATEFLNDGKAMVYLFKNADPSTFLHEFIHTMEPYLKPEDRAVIDKWLDEEKIDKPVARKEALARAFEEFHTNGEAPTEAVKPIFQRIQEVMRKIYEAIKDSPLIKPSKEVNDLFNRWYGGDPEKLSPEAEIEQLLGRPLEPNDVHPTSLFFGEEGTKPLLDLEDKSDAAKEFTAPPDTHEEIGFEPPPGMETPGPGAKNVNTVRETPADILQLRDSLAAVTSPHMGLIERLKKAANLSSAMSRGVDTLTEKWNSLKTNSAAMWNAYRRPLPWTDFKDMLGKWDYADQKSENDAYQFAREIKKKVTDPVRREAIINYIEAGGDDTTLLSQYVRSTNPKYKEGYKVAMELTESERILAENVKNYFESRLQAAIDAGILDHGIDNYIHRLIKFPEKSDAVKKLMGEIAVGKLQTNPRFAMRRIFETSFAAEQAGFEHVNKDVGFLITAYDLSFNRALSARAFVKSMLGGHASDGRPLVAISGSGRTIASEEVGEQSYVIRPTTKAKEVADYKSVDHPALRKWKWVDKDGESNPIYVQGDLLVHPEARTHLKNVLSKSVFRQHAVPRAILKTFGDLKGTMLSLSPFHQVQVATHGVGHWVNPTFVEAIDFENPKTKNLVTHGLQLVNHHALDEFSDGVGGSGYIKYIPGLGEVSQQYQSYLFGDYIPRLKHQMAIDALERNMERYKGKYSNDQIYNITANQANAAFGELNYRMLGRNPSIQDAMRLILLAPDFLEARGRFVGQALKPGGKEQAVALVRMAGIIYGGARVINMIANNGDPKWDKPFSVVINGHEYQIRSIPGDLYHLYKDPRAFALWRVNPFTTRPVMNLLMGKDSFGHNQSTFDAGTDYLKQIMPIPLEGLTKPEVDIWKSMIESFGIRESVYRSPAADRAHHIKIEHLPAGLTKEDMLHSIKMKGFKEQYQAGVLKPWDVQKMLDQEQITPADEKKIMGKAGEHDDIEADLEHRPVTDAMEVWKLTTPQEKAKLRDWLLLKIKRSQTITAKQRQKFTDEVMENAFTPPPPEGFHMPFSE